MILTKEALIEEVEARLNEVVEEGLRLVRLIGCGESEDDYFYILDEGFGARYAKNGSGIYYLSAVGKPFYMREHLPREYYEQLDTLRSLNGAEKVENMLWVDL